MRSRYLVKFVFNGKAHQFICRAISKAAAAGLVMQAHGQLALEITSITVESQA